MDSEVDNELTSLESTGVSEHVKKHMWIYHVSLKPKLIDSLVGLR